MTNPQDPYNSGDTGGSGTPGNGPGDSPFGGGSQGGHGNQGYPSYPGGDATGGGAGGFPSYPGNAGDPGAGQPGYGAAGYGGAGYGGAGYGGGYDPGAAGAPQAKNGVAPWALGFSIVAAVLAVTLFLSFFAPPLGLVGLVLGIIGVVKARKIRGRGRRMGMSVASIIISVLSIIIPIIFMGLGLAAISNTGLSECLSVPAEQQQACVESVLQDMSESGQ